MKGYRIYGCRFLNFPDGSSTNIALIALPRQTKTETNWTILLIRSSVALYTKSNGLSEEFPLSFTLSVFLSLFRFIVTHLSYTSQVIFRSPRMIFFSSFSLFVLYSSLAVEANVFIMKPRQPNLISPKSNQSNNFNSLPQPPPQ